GTEERTGEEELYVFRLRAGFGRDADQVTAARGVLGDAADLQADLAVLEQRFGPELLAFERGAVERLAPDHDVGGAAVDARPSRQVDVRANAQPVHVHVRRRARECRDSSIRAVAVGGACRGLGHEILVESESITRNAPREGNAEGIGIAGTT